MLCLVKQKKRSHGGLLEKLCVFYCVAVRLISVYNLGYFTDGLALLETLLLVPKMQVSTWHRGVEPFTCSLESFLNIFRCLSPLYN